MSDVKINTSGTKELPLQRYNRHAKIIREEYREAGLYDEIKSNKDLFKELVKESIAKEEADFARTGVSEGSKPITDNKKEFTSKDEAKPETTQELAKKEEPKKNKKRKFTLKELGIEGTKTFYKVSVSKIQLPDEWPRFDIGNLAALESSVRSANGINDIVRVIISDNGELIAINHRRVIEAARNVEIKYAVVLDLVTIELMKDEVSSANIYLDLARQAFSKPLNPIEISNCINEAKEAGLTEQDISKSLGTSVRKVNESLSLLGISVKLKKLLLTKKITEEGTLAIIKKAKDETEQDELSKGYITIKKINPVSVKRRALNESQADNKYLSTNRARYLLSHLATAYNSFIRGGSICKESNEEWLDLEGLLNRVRRFKVAGKLPLK